VLSSGTVRGRIGYAPGRWLFYATGGFAWTYNQQTLTQLSTGNSETPFLWRLGWAAGAGVETPIAPHWTARLEYLFIDYGRNAHGFGGGAQPITSDFALQELRAGLNYRLGSCFSGHRRQDADRSGLRQRQLSRSVYTRRARLPCMVFSPRRFR
jgi:high affinity Mn2+ porin